MRHLRAWAVTVLTLGLAGVAAGVLWSSLAPRPPYVTTDQGPVLADPSTQALIAADGWFAVVTGVLGLVCGAAGYGLSRRHPLAVVLGLACGGLLAGCLTLVVGQAVNLGATGVAASGPDVSVVPGPLDLTARGVLCAWPTLAVGLFFVLEAVAGRGEAPPRPLGGREP